MIRILGIALIVLGLVGILSGGFEYGKKTTDVELGPVDLQVREKKTVPVPPIVGAAAIVAGAALLFAGRRRTQA
jgi:hypothetical protein